MVSPFNRWTDQIIAAEDASSREVLAGEIAKWRAGCLSDVARQRDAAHALARLHMLLGRQPSAVQEGQTLMSLCQIPPEASKDEWAEASAFLKTLGGVPPKRRASPANKPGRGRESPGRERESPGRGRESRTSEVRVKPERFESLAPLVTQVLAGERSKVRSRIKGKKSPRLQVMRIWITLQQWSEQEPGEARDRLITHLEHRLRQQLAPDLKIGRPEPSAKPRKEERPKVLTVNPLDVLAATLTAESMPSVETLVTQINALRRARDVFRWIDGAPSLSHERIVAVLQAMHQVVPEGSRVLEGTTLAVRRLCLAGEHEGLMRCLTEGHEAVRYGGEGLDGVLTLAKASLNAGWSLSRVLRGTTRRERRDSEVLAAIGVGADEIWRLVFIKGEQKGEVVTFSALSPEGRAALPQLLLTARNRVVVMSGEPELQEWYGTCGGPEPLTSGQEEAVVAQMTGWA